VFDCDASDSVVLEFDHVRAKRGDVIQMAYDEYSIASL
jgi:hypothetical protein